jgi:P-type Ca2+ transporter type 2C
VTAQAGAALEEDQLVATRGLTSREAAARLAAAGPNTVGRHDAEPLWRELLESLAEPLQLLLLAVGVIYAMLGEIRDAAIIFGVIVTVAGVETWTERRAGRAIAALSKLSAPRALAWRDGSLTELAPEELVVDDVILLSTGSRVPADARLLETDELLLDESIVTGESQPVEHDAGTQADLMSGTYVVRGRGIAQVTAVGASSTLGRIASLVAETESQRTPLQRHLGELARGLLVAALAVSAIVPVIGVLRGQPLREMILTGLTLAFATIPEELPILVVIVLGLGALRLARRGAIVRRLIAAETLGATTLICTDKTGTLTENRMSLTTTVAASEILAGRGSAWEVDQVRRMARVASEPPAGDAARFVDPMDLAVWLAAPADGPEAEVRFSFDSGRRLASGLVHEADGAVLGVKGAPEAVLARATSWRRDGQLEPINDEARGRVLEPATRFAAQGSRVLGVGSRPLRTMATPDRDGLERDLVFEGLLVFSDPLRPEVPAAVHELNGAGVAVSMVTGDQAPTATAIAEAAGLHGQTFLMADTQRLSDEELAAQAARGCVFARARPEDKLRIVRAAGEAGQVVAVTGDGVNDAPALAAAAIGVAMGRGGSDVAREAADLVLTDDNFATLARATGEGRRLYENLRKAVRYYLAIKVALVTLSLVVALAGLPLPFAPVQIVILELFMDIGASAAFVHQAAETDLMQRPPRNPRARFLDRSMLSGILAGGLTLAMLSGGAFLVALPALGVDGARTLALVSWMVGHALLGIVMGWERQPVALRALLRNWAMLAWAAGAAVFALAIVFVAPFAALLHAGPVPPLAAMLTLGAAVVAPLWLEAAKGVRPA